MKNTFRKKVKEFYEKNKLEIQIIGAVAVFTSAAVIIAYLTGKASGIVEGSVSSSQDLLDAFNDGKKDGMNTVFDDIFAAGEKGIIATNSDIDIGTYQFFAKKVVNEIKEVE